MRGLRWGEESFTPVVRQRGGGFEVTLRERTFRFTLDQEAAGVFVLRDGTRCVRFHVAREGDVVHVFWDGVVWSLAVEREGARPVRRLGTGALEAPMPGRVSAVKASPGQRVARGDELLVVEAMKMENALRAPHDGVVRAVHVGVGEMVAPGRALVEIEAEE
jgi:3-methylcrotonyl-CoA carboxylase alpha subunit